MSLPNLDEFIPNSQPMDVSHLKTLLHQRCGSHFSADTLWRKPEVYEMNEDEHEKVSQRKENNKRAAKRSRDKKRNKMDVLEKKARELRRQRQLLLKQREILNHERTQLKNLIIRHASTCPGVRDCLREKLAIREKLPLNSQIHDCQSPVLAKTY